MSSAHQDFWFADAPTRIEPLTGEQYQDSYGASLERRPGPLSVAEFRTSHPIAQRNQPAVATSVRVTPLLSSMNLPPGRPRARRIDSAPITFMPGLSFSAFGGGGMPYRVLRSSLSVSASHAPMKNTIANAAR